MMRLIFAAILICCTPIYCQTSVSLPLGSTGITNTTFVENGQFLTMKCKSTSESIDLSSPRSWIKDGVTLINDGISLPAGSGYSETVGTNEFSLDTPTLDLNFHASDFRCVYKFSQADLTILMFEFNSTDQSDEDCIDGKSIDKCWFSLSKVFPAVSSPNLYVSYEDETIDDISSLLNITSTLNADGKTERYYFKIESTSFSKDVKEIKLTFTVGQILRTLTIKVKDCSQDIFFYGFLPVFLIVLIASIAINILKIDFLSKQFGEFAWKKVGITAVFCVIAIIIGVCLGLLIKGCDKKFLALGLSFLFGILLVVALIIVLIYYHKKCESKSDIQDGDGGEDSNRSSQNNTGSNTTRTGTGRVGSPASTSNVELAANLKSES